MEGKWPNITHRWSVKLTDSNGRNHIYRNHLCFWWSMCPHGALLPRAVLTQSVLLVWNAALALSHPPSPLPPLSHTLGRRLLAAAHKTPQERQSQCADSSNTGSGIFYFLWKFMCCSLFFLLPPPVPEFVTAPQLYVLRRLAALGLEGLLLAFRTFSVTLLRFLLSDPSLDPGSDEVFSFSLLLGFSVVFPKLPEGAKTETGPK